MANTIPVNIRLPELLAANLEEAAKVNKTTKTALITQALVKDYGAKIEQFIAFQIKAGKTQKEAEAMWESL